MKKTDKKSVQQQRVVQVFSKFTTMKFTPQIIKEQNHKQKQSSIQQSDGLIKRVKNYFSPPKNSFTNKSIKSPPKVSITNKPSSPLNYISPQKTLTQEQLEQLTNNNLQNNTTTIHLKHIHRLTPQYVLLGNQDQLDAINLNCLVGDYIDTEIIWSLNLNKKVNLIAIDQKRNIILFILQYKQIQLYQYYRKKVSQKPKRLLSFKLHQYSPQQKPKYVQFFRDSQVIILYETFYDIYSVETNQIQRKSHNLYLNNKGHNLKLFQVPKSTQNKINLFFQQQIPNSTIFSLWCLNIDLLVTNTKMNQLIKVYDIQNIFRQELKIENYSKDIFLLNLGYEIYAIKKGYVIDSANVNIQSQRSYLRYLGNQKLIHVTQNYVDVYKFSIKQSNPPKIYLQPRDSILLPSIGHNFEFFKAIEMLTTPNLALFYQLREQSNLLVDETRYKFCITRIIPLQKKLKMILPSQHDLSIGRSRLKPDMIEQKCNIVRKMGLSNKQIYLKIWNNTPKQTVQDFKFLLSTDHYQTIKDQIEKKLKIKSMSYRQLHTIQKVCCQMLSQKVYGPKFTINQFKNFLISHFLIKKLQLYYELSKISKFYHNKKPYVLAHSDKQISQQDQSRLLTKINIQDYNKFSKVDIKSMLLELISDYCNEQKSEFIEKIRVIFKNFKFTLRIEYFALIEEIIKESKQNFIQILMALPQIIPYKPQFNDLKTPQEPQLYEGVWRDISLQDFEHNLYKQKVLTMYNKQILQQKLPSDVWYKRNWNTLHGLMFLSQNQIIQIHQKNKSNEIFYMVISEIYDRIEDEQRAQQTLSFIENNYDKVPLHLRNNITLYRRLYEYFLQKGFESCFIRFGQFLKLQDSLLFKLIFRYQKIYKNLIFDEIKPIFENDERFNEGLLNYFNSQESQISDVKYMLNRMNNKKREFHIENEQTYEVLVKAIESKIKVGSDKDIPIDQVLIYIECIPLSQDNEIMEQLHVIQQINEQGEKFRKMKLDMSLYEIMNNPDSVISAIVDYEIHQSKVLEMTDFNKLRHQTYRIIAEVQAIKQKIYREQQSDLTFFIYLTRILQQQRMIQYAKQLLKDRTLSQYYTIDQLMIENLVLFMYKQKFSMDPVYVNNQSYINKLLGLLGEGNQCRVFIKNEVELGVYLSPKSDPLWYPLSGEQGIISVFEIESYINHLPPQRLPDIDAEYIYKRCLVLQDISSDQQLSNITLHSIYEFIILKLISNFQLKQALIKTQQFYQKCPQSHTYLWLYPAIILSKLYRQFCQQNRQLISTCSRYLFKQPIKLVSLLSQLLNNKYNSEQQKSAILKTLLYAQQTHHVFDQQSIALQSQFSQLLFSYSPYPHQQTKLNFDIILNQTLKQLLKLKDEFKTYDFHIIFTLLSFDPYLLIKFVFLKRFELNLKHFRCFLSYLIREEIFDKVHVLQLGKRLFKIIYLSLHQHTPIDDVIKEFKAHPITQTQDIQRIKMLQNQMERKISKSLQRFKSKLKIVKSQPLKIKAHTLQQANQRITQIVSHLKSPLSQLIQPLKYAFHDSDDQMENKQVQVKREQITKKQKPLQKSVFDAKLERTLLMSRRFTNTGKQLPLFVSMQKPMTTNMFFSQNFGIKGNLLNELTKSKKFPTLKRSKDLLTNGNPSISVFDSFMGDNNNQTKTNNGSFLRKQSTQKVNNNETNPSTSQKKPRRKFNIAKAQSQFVNLDDFLKFQTFVTSLKKEQSYQQSSQAPVINEIRVQRQQKQQANQQSIQPISPIPQPGYLLAKLNFTKIRKISQQIHDDISEYPTQQSVLTKRLQSSSSKQSVIDIQIGGVQNVQSSGQTNTNNIQMKQIVNELLINKVVQQLLKMFKDQKQPSSQTIKIQVHSPILDKEKDSQHFPQLIKVLVQKIYQQSTKPATNLLQVIKAISDQYPTPVLNKTYLSVYIRMAQLHSKFDLKFPFKKVFISTGLLLQKSSSTSLLYEYISPSLEKYLNEQNTAKVGKILSLGFQKSEIQGEVHFAYLRKLVKQLVLIREKIFKQTSFNLSSRRQNLQVYHSQIQRLEKCLMKLPVNALIQKESQLNELINMFQKDSQTISYSQVSVQSDMSEVKEFNQQTFINLILDCLKKRGQQKIAEMLKTKWDKKLW